MRYPATPEAVVEEEEEEEERVVAAVGKAAVPVSVADPKAGVGDAVRVDVTVGIRPPSALLAFV